MAFLSFLVWFGSIGCSFFLSCVPLRYPMLIFTCLEPDYVVLNILELCSEMLQSYWEYTSQVLLFFIHGLAPELCYILIPPAL